MAVGRLLETYLSRFGISTEGLSVETIGFAAALDVVARIEPGVAEAVVHDDRVRRVFTAPAPNIVWLTDITEHPTMEGKLYCCSIKDVFSNRIDGYALGDRMTAQLAVTALRSAIARRQPQVTVVVHSDRGGQFRSRAFRATLTANRLTGSMGRVAAAADNAAMESF